MTPRSRTFVIVLVSSACVSCASQPTGPTVGVRPPTRFLSGQQGDRPQNLRPDLTVTNGSSIGPVGALSYHFEVATTPSLTPLLIDDAVAEGKNGFTTLRIASRLQFGTVYYWRAQTLDTRSGAKSAFSNVTSFATIAPPQGGEISLLFEWRDECVSFVGEREFTVDGRLANADGMWLFTAEPYIIGPPLAFNFSVDGGQVAGTLFGTTRDQMDFPISVGGEFGSAVTPASAAGTVMPDGTLSGVITTGAMAAFHQSFGLSGGCPGARWTLTTGRAGQPVLR